MKLYVLDANVVLRFLLADHPTQSPASRELFLAAAQGRLTLILGAVTLAEVVWVLDSYYEVDRKRISVLLCGLLLHDGVECPECDVCLLALRHFGEQSVDFADGYVAASAQARGVAVLSYDRDFRKFPDLSCLTPEAAVKD